MKKGPVQQKQRKSKAKKCRHPWYKKPVRFTFHQVPLLFLIHSQNKKKGIKSEYIFSRKQLAPSLGKASQMKHSLSTSVETVNVR